ncbi:MAG: formate/nitrite transporter family protein [Clostridia bacterium]|nr:formate/nitrite transporter family protein [Clostridia bacterium]
MKSIRQPLLGGLLAGLSIAIGGSVFLMVENQVVGALLFSVGLFSVCVFGFSLFTGKVCYVFDNPPAFAKSLPFIWLGNLAGAVGFGLLLLLTRLEPQLTARAAAVCEKKLSQSPLSAFVLAFCCDLLIYIAVEGYKTIPHEVGKYLAILFGVMVFILCGFEHCVANMFYFTVGRAWSLKAAAYLLLMTLGNAAGGVALPLLRKAFSR